MDPLALVVGLEAAAVAVLAVVVLRARRARRRAARRMPAHVGRPPLRIVDYRLFDQDAAP